MKVITVKDYHQMSQQAASIIIKHVNQKPNLVLGLATGGTPEGIYRQLVNDHKQNGTSYQQVTTFNLDEYINLPRQDRNSYYSYMKKHLFDHIDLQPDRIHLPNSEAHDLSAECKQYEALIEQAGQVDIQLLGIGSNGHIGFNEPGTSFDSLTHIVDLDESTRIDNSRYFDNLAAVPTQAITMGIQTIMRAKEILLVASGESKIDAMKQLLSGKVTEAFPASILNEHPNVTVIIDEQAYPRMN